MSNPNRSSFPNKRSRDLMNRLIPKQQIHNHPVTFGVTMGKNPKSKIRSSINPNSNIKIKKLPPLPELQAVKLEKAELDSQRQLSDVDYESLTDPFEFIKLAKERNDYRSFVFLYPSEGFEDSENPTNLRIIPHEQALREDFWNLSLNGLTHVTKTSVDFKPLDEWLKSLQDFSKIMQIPFFKYQRQWRYFRLWKRAVQTDKMTYARTSLSSILFFAHSVLRPAFITIQKELNKLQTKKLFAIYPGNIYTLKSFLEENEKYREVITKEFDDFFLNTLQIVQDACEKTIDKLNTGDSENQEELPISQDESIVDQWIAQYNRAKKHGPSSQSENGPSLTYTKRASHRAVCQKLVRFIRLVDYVIVSTLRQICFTSLLELYTIMNQLFQRGIHKIGYEDPQPIQPLELPNEYEKIYQTIQNKTSELFSQPIFRIDVNYTDQMNWKPSQIEIINTIDVVRTEFIEVLFKVPRLLVNPIFRQYIANDITYDKNSPEKMSTPDLAQIIYNDQIFKDTMKNGSDVITHSFNLLAFYSNEFQKAIDMYQENQRFTTDWIDSDDITAGDVKTKIKEYYEQEAFLRTVVDKSEVGIFQIYLKEMKQLFMKSPGICLSQIRQRIPFVTERFLSEFTQKVRKADEELSTPIEDVASFVQYIHAVTSQNADLPNLQRLQDVIKGFQSLATEQSVYISSDEVTEFQETIPIFDQVKRALAFSEEQKATMQPKFAQILEKSISKMHSEVLDVQEMANNRKLSSNRTSPKLAANLLCNIIALTDQIDINAKDYNYYQKSMGLQVIKFDDVDDLVTNVHLKQLLWETKTEWITITDKWYQQSFKTIDPSAMIDQLNAFQERSLKAYSGLPNNEVADELRASISDFANLIPIVSDLKNPALNQSHMDQITSILGGDIFDNDSFKFGRLVELHAYNFVDQVAAISAQATNEHQLQEMLNSVRSILDTIQYTINPCKFQKACYLLDGTEDILAQLDDAEATISSVRSSKYIAPLRSKADELMKNVRQVQYIAHLLDAVQSQWSFITIIFQAGDIARQLQSDAKDLQTVDKTWKNVSTKLNDDPSLFFKGTNPNLTMQIIPDLENAKSLLEKIRKSLEDFLEQKRIGFPRLYFISNDELLDLISKSKDPNSVIPYLPKLFNGIYSMEVTFENHVPFASAVFSVSGERLNLRPVKFRNNIELWLANIEETIVRTMKTEMKNSKAKFSEMIREDWISVQTSQLAFSISQTEWQFRAETCFQAVNPIQAFTDLLNEIDQKVSNLMKLTHLDLRDNERDKISSLIQLDLHFRDIVSSLINKNITDASDYEWKKNFMLKWDDLSKELIAIQFNDVFKYGYEFVTSQRIQIITPQYEKCQSALSLTLARNYGGIIFGPSGAGKTEMIKDLAKSLGYYYVVISCGNSITTLQMGSLFRGIVQSGCFCCLQEIQRLSDETLSVADWHLSIIRQATLAGLKKFYFDSYEIQLNNSYCFFGTVSTKESLSIPSHIKDYFRPISIAEINEEQIVEITLLTLGFEEYTKLTKLLLQFMKYCRTILNQQPFYDFGITTIKRILSNAGTLLHTTSEVSEESIISKAVINVISPMLTSNDRPMFMSLLKDPFQEQPLQTSRIEEITEVIKTVCENTGIEAIPYTLLKTEQLHRMATVRPSIILVGATDSGKTTSLDILESSYNQLSQTNDEEYYPVSRTTIYPNTFSYDELYGSQNIETGMFTKGIIETIFDNKNISNMRKQEWIVFDGSIRSNWIENMNTLIDQNQLLTLANAKFIRLQQLMHIFFEVDDLSDASPSTLSRASIIYFESNQIGISPFLDNLVQKKIRPLFEKHPVLFEKFKELIDSSVHPGIEFLNENQGSVSYSSFTCIESLITLFIALSNDLEFREKDGIQVVIIIFTFSFIWAFGGHLSQTKRILFDSFIRDIFGSFLNLPNRGLVYDWTIDTDKATWSHWSDHVPKFQESASTDFDFNASGCPTIYVQTNETYRISFIMKLFLHMKKNIILRGQNGIGKTLVVNEALTEIQNNDPEFNYFPVEFTPQTTSQSAYNLLMNCLERKHGEYLRPLCDKSSALYIENINSAQPDAIDLLREIFGSHTIYLRPSYQCLPVTKLSLLGIASPSNELNPRFMKHAAILEMTPFDSATSTHIVHSILQLFFSKFEDPIKNAESRISNSIISIYESVSSAFQVSIDSPHLVFGFRDVMRVVRGILIAAPNTFTDGNQMERLWAHEVTRVYCDRLISPSDIHKFDDILQNCIKKKLNSEQQLSEFDTYFAELNDQPMEKSMLMAKVHNYMEYRTIEDATNALQNSLTDYLRQTKKTTTFPISLFDFSVKHIFRLNRIIKSKEGNAILLGEPGSGKRTVARFVAFMNECDVIEFENINTLHEDFKSICFKSGTIGRNVMLIIGDEQMKNDTFMEDLSSLINGSDITTMYNQDDLDKMYNEMMSYAKIIRQNESNPNLKSLFLERMSSSIHIVFCISPYEYNLKDRFNKYPSFVKHSTIDYYQPWPDVAFTTIASSMFNNEKVSDLVISIHQNVAELARKLLKNDDQKYFVTPSLFLQFVDNYQNMAQKRKSDINKKMEELNQALSKLSFTDNALDSKSNYQPQLEEKTLKAEKLNEAISQTQILLNNIQKTIEESEGKLERDQQRIEKITKECQMNIELVKPQLESSIDTLKGLNRNDISELRGYDEPPPVIRTVMEVICILVETDVSWKAACNILSDPLFINKISTRFNDERHVPATILKKVQPYIETNPNFQENEVGRVSVAAKCLCNWAASLYNYEIMYKKVEPEQQTVVKLQTTMKKRKEKLKQKMNQMKSYEDSLDDLKQQFDLVTRETRRLNESINESQSRIGNATKLAKLLRIDKNNWQEASKKLIESAQYIEGDSFLCAALITYFGPFPPSYRKELFDSIIRSVNSAEIKITPGFTFVKVMTDPTEIQEWHNCGLPNDQTSIENAIIMRDSPMAPLIIDNLGFANQFIKLLEKDHQIVVLRPTQNNFLKIIESNMRLGIPVLLEHVTETFDPSLDNIIARRIILQDGKRFMKINERLIEFDDKFKLYLTTKMAHPIYTPEMFSSATIINFYMSKSSLLQFELSKIVDTDNPELGQTSKTVMSNIIECKSSLKQIDDRFLDLIKNSGNQILDDEVLINTIETSSNKRKEIQENLFRLDIENEKYSKERAKYEPLSERLAVIFFAITNLSKLNPLYHFSLDFIETIVLNEIKQNTVQEDRMLHLLDSITLALFTEIGRGILPIHRLPLAFIIASAILRSDKKINDAEWAILVKGLPKIPNKIENPSPNQISAELWDEISSLSNSIAAFRTLPSKVLNDPSKLTEFISSDTLTIPDSLSSKLDDLQKLLFVKAVSPDKLGSFVKLFVDKNLGNIFNKQIEFDLNKIKPYISPQVPLLMIMESDETDAREIITKFAEKENMLEKLKTKALSRADEPKLEKELISIAARGEWILYEFIENSGSFISEFCSVVSKVSSGSYHPDFRIFVTTKFDSQLPSEISLRCSKVVIEKQKNLKAELVTLINSLSNEFFESEQAIRLSFSIIMYHAILIHRQKYGLVGFNAPYVFTINEFNLACSFIQPYLKCEEKDIQYQYLCFFISEMIYGGHALDLFDANIMKELFISLLGIKQHKQHLNDNSPEDKDQALEEKQNGEEDQTAEESNNTSVEEREESHMVLIPKVHNKDELLSFIMSLPDLDSPSIFGLHENATISDRKIENEQINKSIIDAICDIRVHRDVIKETVMNRLKNLIPSIPELEDIEDTNDDGGSLNFSDSMTIILTQETTKIKQTIEKVKKSSLEIEKTLYGFIPPLQSNLKAIQEIADGKVPTIWKTFEGFFTFDSWIKELIKRINFFNSWVRRGRPLLTDLSCFADPVKFLNAFKMNFLKVNKIAHSDQPSHISFNVTIISENPDQQPELGIYITGMHFQGAVFNMAEKVLVEEQIGDDNDYHCPILHIIPKIANESDTQNDENYYNCPVYRIIGNTSEINRKQNSTELITKLPIPSNKTQSFWTIRGTSLLLNNELY